MARRVLDVPCLRHDPLGERLIRCMLVLNMAIDGATTGARRMRSSRTAHGLSISTAVRPSGRPMARNTSCVQVEPDLFVLREEGAQVFRQKRHDGRQVGDHAHVAAQPLGMLGEFLPDLVDAEQDAPRVGQQRPAGRCELHAARVSAPSYRIARKSWSVVRSSRLRILFKLSCALRGKAWPGTPAGRTRITTFATPIRQTRTLSPADNGS